MAYMKAGITVVVTTWENDGDNYKIKQLSGLSEACALAVSSFCELFRSKNARGKRGIGNADRDELDFEVLASQLSQADLALLDSELSMSLEQLYDALIGSWCDGEYVRVFEKIKFLKVPVDIEEVKLQ